MILCSDETGFRLRDDSSVGRHRRQILASSASPIVSSPFIVTQEKRHGSHSNYYCQEAGLSLYEALLFVKNGLKTRRRKQRSSIQIQGGGSPTRLYDNATKHVFTRGRRFYEDFRTKHDWVGLDKAVAKYIAIYMCNARNVKAFTFLLHRKANKELHDIMAIQLIQHYDDISASKSTSKEENLVSLLQKLQDESSCITSRYIAIEKLFRWLIIKNGIKSDEIQFDFVMSDGIDIMIYAIQQEGCPSQQIHQTFQILLEIAKSSKCHWQTIFKSIGGIDGIIKILEGRQMDYFILCDIFDMMTRLIQSDVLKIQGSQIVIWLSFYDLILEGMEANVSNLDTFYSFLQFIQIQTSHIQMHQRIFSLFCRGRDAHVDDLRCQRLVQQQLNRFVQIETSDSLRMITMHDGTANSKTKATIDTKRHLNSFCRCAPAA